jgi:hypothetical protein
MTRFLKELFAVIKEQADEPTSLPDRTWSFHSTNNFNFFKSKCKRNKGAKIE